MRHYWDDLIEAHLGPASSDPLLRVKVEKLVDAVAQSLTREDHADHGQTVVPEPTVPYLPAPDPTIPGLPPIVTPPPDLDPKPTWDPTGTRPSIMAGRYEDQGELGVGGMGEVRRVHDTVLRRDVAMKIVGEVVQKRPHWLARFVEEAQATGQLEHPGIVPVHDLGRLPDGRLYYTMREVHGRGLDELIDALHDASDIKGGAWVEVDGWSFRRLVEALRSAADAVGYAHARGVLHRDLKPANIMLGTHGEVLVVDWGLAKIMGSDAGESIDPVVTERSLRERLKTRMGQAAGTPDYMPPEQREGRLDDLGPQADVYALGITLFELMTGRRPRPDARSPAALEQALDSVPAGRHIPQELRVACLRAIESDPARRFANARELSAAIQDWLEGAKRRERALELLERAAAHLPRVAKLHGEADKAEAEARSRLDAIPQHAPVAQKRPGWALEDRATTLRANAEAAEQAFLLGVQSALEVHAGLPEAHQQLADHYRQRHEAAEARRDPAEAARFETLLRRHDDGRHAGYLAGDGTLTLATEVPARAVLHRYVTQDRRLVPVCLGELGTTPLQAVPLRMGTYLIELSAPGHHTVRYPVAIRRGQHWRAVPPGSTRQVRVALPPAGSIADDECYIAAGPFQCGGDPAAAVTLTTRELWLDAFCMRTFPVTNAEYVAFLDDLVDRGRAAEALDHAPREKGGRAGSQGAVIYGRDDAGHFVIGRDADGDLWLPDAPVVMIGWESATAYARWLADRTGLPWRLPFEVEWEKAARGVDGRLYPWGDFLDPTWAVVRELHPEAPTLLPIGQAPVDESPYGVRDLAGGVRDWCADPFTIEGPLITSGGRTMPYPPMPDVAMRSDRGGSWCESSRSCRVACRDSDNPLVRSSMRGFRLCRSVGG